MALAKWNRSIQNERGQVVPNASVRVLDERTRQLAVIYTDRDGVSRMDNPFQSGPSGEAEFHAVGGSYQVTADKDGFSATWRFEAIGTAQEYDVDQLIEAAGSGILPFNTRAEMNAVTPSSVPAGAVVWNDSTPANNGYYTRNAANTAWVFSRPLPASVGFLNIINSDPNEVVAVSSTQNPMDAPTMFTGIVTRPNTDVVTLAINGSTARPVVSSTGQPLAPGEWTGLVLVSLNASSQYQMAAEPAVAQFVKDHLQLEAGGDVALRVLDKYRFLIGEVLRQGVLRFRGLDISSSGTTSGVREIRTAEGVVELLGTVMEYSDQNKAIQVLDKFGNVILSLGGASNSIFVNVAGAQYLSAGEGSLDVSPSGVSINGLSIEKGYPGDFGVLDRYGFIVVYSGHYGSYAFTADSSGGGGEVTYVRGVSNTLGFQARSEVKGVICYGQSLSRGSQAVPALSITQNFLNVMLAGGSKVRPGDGRYNGNEFAPLIEEVSGTEGETPLAGCVNSVTRRAVQDGSTAEEMVFFGASPGAGGRTVFQLSPDDPASNWYSGMIQIVRDAYRVARAEGRSFSLWSVLWFQGENDYSANSPDTLPWQYQDRLLNSLWMSLVTEAKRITGQDFDPYMFEYQVAAHRRYARDHMRIALAQWNLSKQMPFMIMTAPAYIFPVAADNLHLTNIGSWLMGEYTGYAMYKTMVERSGKFRPLEPVSGDWSTVDNKIVLRFHVPSGRLVFDTSWVSMAENYGFGIRNASDQYVADAITSVEITGRDEVTINLAPSLGDNLTLTYARGKPGDPAHSGPVTGARGNLRDTAGTWNQVTSPDGSVTIPMHNYSVMFQFSMINGF